MKEKKYFKVSEEQMDLLVSIVNKVIERSDGCKDGEWSVDDNGMWMCTGDSTWGFIDGDDMTDAQEDEEDVINGLKFVLNDCFDNEYLDMDEEE